jgi:arylsulfatase A-like enzyme
MNEVLRVLAASDPAFVLTALPDVDRTAHLFGPDSQEAWRALLEADRQIERLVGFLKARGTWADTVLILTADHGFVSVAPDAAAGRPYPLVLFGRTMAAAGIDGLTVFSEGPVESILVAGGLDGAGASLLARVRALALAQPEIAEAWYRRPNAADGGEQFTEARARPEWRMDHARGGDLVLVAKRGFTFSDPYSPSTAAMVGMHGGPETMRIPIVVTGGWPRLKNGRAADGGDQPTAANPDIGATALWLLGVRAPRLLRGGAVPPDLAGRVLREAFTEAAAPDDRPSPR